MNELQPWATFVTIAHGRKIQGGAVNSLVVESLCNLETWKTGRTGQLASQVATSGLQAGLA